MPDTVLIEFTLTDTTVDAFMAKSSSFLTLLRQLLINGGMTDVVVKVYAAISAEDNSNNRDTTTSIMLALIHISSAIFNNYTLLVLIPATVWSFRYRVIELSKD